MKRFTGRLPRIALAALALALLGGCYYPGYYARPGVVYDDGRVASGPAYSDDGYYASPGYYAGPSYYGPSYYYGPGYYDPWWPLGVGIGFYGGYYYGGHYGHGGHGGHGGGHGGHSGGGSHHGH